ncbi:MAG: aminoacyl-tRNA hydrolase [Chlorobi bacterium]|nr:aminoacyl-tRNA hydrolase [Chlorobiota bacterium]
MTKRSFEKEFEFITSRSSGKGGQHVNRTNTKVELRFNIDASEILNDDEKKRLKEKLSGKINNEGILQIVSQETRSQLKNKNKCIEKFYLLIEDAFKVKKKRKKTKPSKKSVEKRLEEKKKHSEKKENRRKDFI